MVRCVRIAAGAILIAGLGFSVPGCGSSGGGSGSSGTVVGPNGGTVTSSDQKVTLTIPAGALGNNEKITIESIDPATLPPEFDGIQADAAYDLQPDGLQFSAPVEVSVSLDAPVPAEEGDAPAEVSMLLTSSGGTVEALDNLILSTGAEDQTAFLTGELTHFSKLVHAFSINDNATVSGIPNKPVLVGQTFETTLSVNHGVGSDLSASRLLFRDFAGKPTLSLTAESQSKFTVEVPFSTKGIDYGKVEAGVGKLVKDTFDYVCNEAGLGFFRTILSYESLSPIDGRWHLANGYYAEFNAIVFCQEPASTTGTDPFTDDQNDRIDFSVDPPLVIKKVGDEFNLAVSENYINIAGLLAADPGYLNGASLLVFDRTPGIVSVPVLSDPPTAAGTSEVELLRFPNDVYADNFSVLELKNLVNGNNTQNLKFQCVKAGNTLIGIELATRTITTFFQMVQVRCQDTGTGGQTGLNPNDPPPDTAVAWKVVNSETGHVDGPFALPGAANPNQLEVIDPKAPGSGFWEVPNDKCSYIHLAGVFRDHSADDTPCRHGGLEYILGTGGSENPTFSDPNSAVPDGAVAWKAVNPDIGHEDGPFALPGAANPNQLEVIDPKALPVLAHWAQPDECSLIHLHGFFNNHPDPAPSLEENPNSACGHGGLVYLFQ